MMRLFSGAMVVCAIVSAGSAAGRDRVARSTPGGGPATFDVAGVRLGASPAEAKAGLVKAGYRIDDAAPTASFEQDTQRQAARRQGRTLPWSKDAGIFKITATGPHQEYAEVKLVQRPGGSQVSSVTVQIPQEAMTTPAFRQQVTTKYGKPLAIRSQGIDMYWCSPEAARSCGVTFVPDGPQDNAYPRLLASSGNGGGRLWLEVGSEAEKRDAREREAAIVKLAPKTDRAAF